MGVHCGARQSLPVNLQTMKIVRKSHQPMRQGFSMIEMLVVVAIIAVLAGMGFGTFMLVGKNAKISQAELMIENVSSSLEARLSEGFSKSELADLGDVLDARSNMPTGSGGKNSTRGLYRILSGDFNNDGRIDEGVEPAFPEIDPEYEGAGRYVNDDRLLIDPWRQPLRYQYPGINNNVEDGFDIWSAGPDGEFDTDDDINNW